MIKRRAIGIVLTVVAMAFAMIPLMGNDKAFADDNVVATIGDTPYESLAAAVEAAGTEPTEITLVANTQEGITIPAGADITIDLNGHTIANRDGVKEHTFHNLGKLNLLSSVDEPEAVIDNTTHATACVMNRPGGEVTISGNIFLNRSNLPLTGTYDPNKPPSWYNICNRGEMTINDGVRVINRDDKHTAVATGFWDTKEIPTPGYEAKLTVNGGYFEGNLNAFKVDSAGELIFNDGEAVNNSGTVIISWHKMTINGGTIRGATPLNLSKYNGSEGGYETELGITQITGGTFTCGENRTMFTRNVHSIGGAELTITGGTFNGSFNSIHQMGKNSSGEPYIKCHIEGGKFDRDVNAIYNDNATLPEGKVLRQDEDSYWTLHEITPATIEFSSDGNGKIDDWTFRGDADCNKKITVSDLALIYKIVTGAAQDPTKGSDKDSQRKARNADADADGEITTLDMSYVYKILTGSKLPFNTDAQAALTFEVKDIPKSGYEISAVTVNDNLLNIPAKGQSVTTEVGGVTYKVSIDADGKGSVFGKYLEENKVAFEHTPVITPKGDEDPEKKDDPKTPKEEEFNKMVNNLDNDGDLAGSTFGLLKARGVSKGKKKILLKWTDPKLGAAKYVVYGNQCNTKGKKYKYVKLKEFNANTFKYVPSDILGKKLKKGTYYKFLVTAVDKNGRVVAISKTVHVTTKGKRGNDKAVKRVKPTKKAKYTLNAGKTKKLKVKEVKGKKRVARHRVVSWESSNPNVVVVSKKGKVAAKGKGTCTIFAYAQNGVYTTFKITVK